MVLVCTAVEGPSKSLQTVVPQGKTLENAGDDDTASLHYLGGGFAEEMACALSKFDCDGKGRVHASELMAGAKALQQLRQENVFLRRVVVSVVLFLILLMCAIFGTTVWAIKVMKDTWLVGSTMVDMEGHTVQVAISDLTVTNGTMVSRCAGELCGGDGGSGAALGTAPVLTKHPLSSRIPDHHLRELREFVVSTMECNDQVETVDGSDWCQERTLKIGVNSYSRVPRLHAHCGSVVIFQTSMGEFTLDDEDLFHDGLAVTTATFAAGENQGDGDRARRLSVHGRQLGARRLVAAQEMTGAFNFLDDLPDLNCTMGGILENETNVEPPSPPTLPFAYLARKETACSFGERQKDACTSYYFGPEGSLKPGAAMHSQNGGARVTSMTHFQHVLETETQHIVVTHFPSQPLTRLVSVEDSITGNKTRYTLLRGSAKKLNCETRLMEESVLQASAERRTSKDHLAYLGRVSDPHGEYHRWSASPVKNGTLTGLHAEFWEGAEADSMGRRSPRRLFVQGPDRIAPGVEASLFAGPMEFLRFAQGLELGAVQEWLRAQQLPPMPAGCENEEGQTYPAALGPYAEGLAERNAQLLVDMSHDELETVLGHWDLPWPSSYRAYWLALVRQQKSIWPGASTAESAAAIQLPSTPTNGTGTSRRLQGCEVGLPSWVAERLGFDLRLLCPLSGWWEGCWSAVSQQTIKPDWASSLGVDINVNGDAKICPQYNYAHSQIQVRLAKGFCADLPWAFPVFNMAALPINGGMTLSATLQNSELSLEGNLYLGLEGGIYSGDNTWRYCNCHYCDPGSWESEPDSRQRQCGCERTRPGGSRRRDSRRRQGNGPEGPNGHDDTDYQARPVPDIGAHASLNLKVQLQRICKGCTMGGQAILSLDYGVSILSYGLDFPVLEDIVLFYEPKLIQL